MPQISNESVKYFADLLQMIGTLDVKSTRDNVNCMAGMYARIEAILKDINENNALPENDGEEQPKKEG